MRVPFHLLRETVSIEDYSQSGPRGPIYLAPYSIRALMQATQRLQTAEDGHVVAITVVMIARPEDGPVPVQSRVTWAGTTYRVVNAFAMPDTRRPTHWEFNLTRLEN